MNIQQAIAVALLSGCATTIPCPELVPEYVVYKCPQAEVQLAPGITQWTEQDAAELRMRIWLSLSSVPPKCIVKVVKYKDRKRATDEWNEEMIESTESLFHFPVKVRIKNGNL